MAITYINSASTPTDGGINTAPTTTSVTPPGSMVAGDLVVVWVGQRATANTFAVSATGGQTWTSETQPAGTNNTKNRVFWCRFNGTWSSDPSFSISGGTVAFTVVMHVFRPTASANTWSVDVAVAETTQATALTFTHGSVNTTAASTVAVVLFTSQDDNTWGTLTGTGWVVTGTAQYRNNSNHSMSFAHRIQTSPGATNSVSKTQLTLGSDSGASDIIAFAETTVATDPIPNRLYKVNQTIQRASVR